MSETDRILNARKRLLVQAERAFGSEAVTWTSSANLPAEETQDVSLPAEVGLAVAADGTFQMPRGNRKKAKAATELPRPRPMIDLFGKSVAAQKADAAPPAEPLGGLPLPLPEREIRLRVLDESQVKGCTKCPLHETRTNTVFGKGVANARLLFIGEGPGENEDQTGLPFVGRAGQLLDKMIGAMGLSLESVYIANIVKCRPPQNRQPTSEETATCTPYLLEQIEVIRPEVIVTLGLPASRYMLNSNLAMGKLRGRWHEWRGIRLMPTYHPAYVLRSYNEQTRRTVWGDLQMVMAALDLPGAKS